MALITTKTDHHKLYHFGSFFYHNSKIKKSWPLNFQNSEQTSWKYCFSVKTWHNISSIDCHWTKQYIVTMFCIEYHTSKTVFKFKWLVIVSFCKWRSTWYLLSYFTLNTMLHLAFLFQSRATLICYYYLYEVDMFHLNDLSDQIW